MTNGLVSQANIVPTTTRQRKIPDLWSCKTTLVSTRQIKRKLFFNFGFGRAPPLIVKLRHGNKRIVFILSYCPHRAGLRGHEILQLEETTVKEMAHWKATPRDNAFLKISNGAPIQDSCPTDVSTTEIKTSRWDLTMVLQFSVISLQHILRWKFRNMFTE